jgi:hypothetical protein
MELDLKLLGMNNLDWFTAETKVLIYLIICSQSKKTIKKVLFKFIKSLNNKINEIFFFFQKFKTY